ncbi:MAG: MATE family efflux transporter [Erysipelotrichaceae bacterium]|nr:MATE family efflux transporter [Erysipelotrichaceae bacterium]
MSEKKNKMATWPIPKLLFSMGLPAVFSMLIQAMYNVVDSIYISNYSKDCMFAIGIANPLQLIGLSIALGSAVGTSTLLARRLGQGDIDEANKVAANGFILTGFHTIITVCLGLFVAKPFLALFTDRPEIIEYGYIYLSIVLIISFGQQFSIYFERLFQSQGEMKIPMFGQLIGAITNIILDPILIFGQYGFTEMGIKGAAVATVVGQILSLIFLIACVLIKKPTVRLRLSYLKKGLKAKRVKDIYAVGLPAMVMNMINSVTTTAMNGILVKFSEDAITSLSLYFKLQSFVLMPVFGFNQGALPILSFNYGANDRKRYLQAVKLFWAVAETICVAGMILFAVTPDIPLSFFETDAELLRTAEIVISTIGISFVFVAPNIVITTILQSFGMGTHSMIQSISRQLIVLLPLAIFLSRFGLRQTFFAYPIAEFVMLLVFIPIAIKAYKTKFAYYDK